MRGQPITLYEREQIQLLLLGRWSLRNIAKKLYRDHSVIVREVQRNKSKDARYRAEYAHKQALKRREKERVHKLDTDDVLRNYVVQRMKEGWSPEKISGRLKNLPDSYLLGSYVSHETIYQYI